MDDRSRETDGDLEAGKQRQQLERKYGDLDRWLEYFRQMGVHTLSDLEREYFVHALRLVRTLDDQGIEGLVAYLAKLQAEQAEIEEQRKRERAARRAFAATVVTVATVLSCLAALLGVVVALHVISPVQEQTQPSPAPLVTASPSTRGNTP